ncbi:MAG TPA: ABC transporter ATP-binding protein [Elusimicrobiota bacterium]|nr:ABC transporter ATP-binding protein [Elusimicrobiota bacterium]
MIEIQNLVKHYGDTKAVDDVSFEVRPGEVVGLLGPNGAGKSTTLRVLTGYLPPTHGTVRLGGMDIQSDPLAARKQVGYLSESNPLYESLGVWECLDIVARLRGLPADSIARRVTQVVAECSLQDVVSKDIGALSKGYRQRLGLALAILHDPDILVFDEPSSALDPNQQKEVRDLILKLKEKKTVLLSTHILPEAQVLCDRLLIIHRGKIVAQGTVAELQGQAAGEKTFYVRLAGPAREIEPSLRSLPGLTRVEFADEQEAGCPAYRVSGAGDPRGALFQLASERRWPLMELRREAASLDEIFRMLTGNPS